MKPTKDDSAVIDELGIVDVLTKLIFDADSPLEGSELLLLDMLVQVEDSLAGTCRRDIGEYLRAMGVDEMIRVVNRIKRLADQQQLLVTNTSFEGNSLNR